jgi:L-fuculose-phosphate aldolase
MVSSPRIEDFAAEAEALCEVGRLAWQRGFVAAWDGNLSIRVDEDLVLCTPTRQSKGFLKPTDLCLVDLAGAQIAGARKATSEIRMHLLIYRHSPEKQGNRAIVHLHPPHATALAVCHAAPPAGLLAETDLYLGAVPVIPYKLTGTQEFADALLPFLPERVAFLLANHGAVTTGRSMDEAWGHMEILEQASQVTLLSGFPKEAQLLPQSEIDRLSALRRTLYNL